MTIAQRLRGAGIAIAILVLVFPVSAIVTIVCFPFWLWFETHSGIESYGHSGPAQWCYLATYIVLVIVCTAIWSNIRRSTSKRHGSQAPI